MILLLTLAGRDQRFRSEGFKTPTYLLPWGDRTVLAAILDEFLKGGAFGDAFLVANRADEAYAPHVRAILRAHGIHPSRLSLTDDTSGQAETARVGLDAIETARGASDDAIVVGNSDTILYGRDYAGVARTLRDADGFIDVFKSNDRSYSYVLLDDQNRVQEIAEKMVVSNVATSGCYGFRSAAVYRAHYAGGDRYVSDVFKKMLASGARVVAGARHTEDDTVVLSSPDEYMNASAVRL